MGISTAIPRATCVVSFVWRIFFLCNLADHYVTYFQFVRGRLCIFFLCAYIWPPLPLWIVKKNVFEEALLECSVHRTWSRECRLFVELWLDVYWCPLEYRQVRTQWISGVHRIPFETVGTILHAEVHSIPVQLPSLQRVIHFIEGFLPSSLLIRLLDHFEVTFSQQFSFYSCVSRKLVNFL